MHHVVEYSNSHEEYYKSMKSTFEMHVCFMHMHVFISLVVFSGRLLSSSSLFFFSLRLLSSQLTHMHSAACPRICIPLQQGYLFRWYPVAHNIVVTPHQQCLQSVGTLLPTTLLWPRTNNVSSQLVHCFLVRCVLFPKLYLLLKSYLMYT